jgi:hypothetical protein
MLNRSHHDDWSAVSYNMSLCQDKLNWMFYPLPPDGVGHSAAPWLVMCFPTKTGHTAYEMLFNHHNIRRRIPYCCRAAAMVSPQQRSSFLAYLTVRNPYERLLSAFLSQLTARDRSARIGLQLRFARGGKGLHASGRGNVRGDMIGHVGTWNATPADFRDFVRSLVTFPHRTEQQPLPFGSHYGVDHFDLITRSTWNCMQPAYRNHQTLRSYYSILKLERQAEWYPGFIAATGLRHRVSSRAWPSGCFWKPEGRTCAEALEKPPPSEADAAEMRSCSFKVGGGHNKNACHHLRSFYDRETTDLVSTWAREDLETFEYPRWDYDKVPAPLSGPPLHRAEHELPLHECRVGHPDRPFASYQVQSK